MKEWIKSESTVKPLELDTVSSEFTVYLRENIVEEEREDESGNKYTMFVYDECQIPKQDWIVEQTEQNTADTQYIAIMTGIDLEG